jgi:hypothetical protein
VDSRLGRVRSQRTVAGINVQTRSPTAAGSGKVEFASAGAVVLTGSDQTQATAVVNCAQFVTLDNANLAVTAVRFATPGTYVLQLSACDGVLTRTSSAFETLARRQVSTLVQRPRT